MNRLILQGAEDELSAASGKGAQQFPMANVPVHDGNAFRFVPNQSRFASGPGACVYFDGPAYYR